MTQQQEYIIRTEGLTKRFGSFRAVDGISLAVRKGTIHGFIGPNGAGKTTTMKMLIGALKPTSGGGTIKGKSIGSLDSRRAFGFSPEHPHFYDDMTAHDYLTYMGRISGLSKGKAEARAAELLAWLDLKDFSHKKVGGFSAGMRQKLSLAQAMIHEPEILILDEPTANLDPAGRLSIIQKLKQLCKEREMTVFISSHILSELEKLVDEFTIINHGRLVTKEALGKEAPAGEYLLKASDGQKVLRCLKKRFEARIDDAGTIHIIAPGDDTAFKREVVKILAECDASLEAFGKSTPDLEQLFMKIVGKGDGT